MYNWKPTLLLADTQKTVVEAWKKAFDGVEGIDIYHGSIFDKSAEALVSPANSFGFMDGGIDMAISQRLGWEIQDRVQKSIRLNHYGELLVGQALIVQTDSSRFKWVICAPTMRVPMTLGPETINVYLATRAVLLLVIFGKVLEYDHPVREFVKRIAFPGMGTGVGQVPASVCAHQMRMAYDEVFDGKVSFPVDWYDAQTRHQLLYTDKPRDLQ